MSAPASYGDVTATITRCTVLNADGETCGRVGMAGLPMGVCELHALTITRAVLKLGGITLEERR